MDATDLLEQVANACEAWDAKNLRFEADGHKYTYDGRPMPSVTQVLRESGLTEAFIPDDSYYADFGTAVHQAIHYDNEGDLDMETLDPELATCVQSWREWKTHIGFEPLVSELIVCDPIFRYAGTLDMIGLIPSHRRPALVDIKTGQIPKTAGLQMAGYARPLPFKVNRMVVRLPRDGGYSVRSFDNKEDEKVFLAALAVANWKRRVG